MKAKVLRAFIDRGTGTGYNAGEVYESSASSRLDELTAGGFIEVVAPRSKKPPSASAAYADKDSAAKAKE